MTIRKHEKMDYTLTNFRTFYSIMDIIRKKIPIKEIWMVQNGGSKNKEYDDDIDIYNVYSYSDFVEIMTVLKPDLVVTIGGDFEYLERSMLKAAKARGVPTVDIASSLIEQSFFKKGFSNAMLKGRLYALSDHGKLIMKKYFFLLRTLYRGGYGIKYILATIIKDIYLPISTFVPRYNFDGGDLNIISTPEWLGILTARGITEDRIAITGECSMDSIYHDLLDLKIEDNQDVPLRPVNKLRILILSTPMVEHGYWTVKMRNELVADVVKALKENFLEKIELKLKIHPVNETIQVYREILKDIYPDVEIFQQTNLINLLKDSDIVIGFGITSAYFQALLLRKPILLMNIFNEDVSKNIYMRENIVTECKSAEELINHIKNKSYDSIDEKRLNTIIDKVFYKFDGKCTERASESIIELLKKFHKID
jgi:hypothetical protein